MSNEDSGYGKPPKSGQFAKGKSGNPAGRPKGSKNLATLLHETVHEKVIVNENNKRKALTKLQATLKQLANKAAMGDLRAAQQLLSLLQQVEMKESTHTSASQAFSITKADELVMEDILQRVRQSVLEEVRDQAVSNAQTQTKGETDEAP